MGFTRQLEPTTKPNQTWVTPNNYNNYTNNIAIIGEKVFSLTHTQCTAPSKATTNFSFPRRLYKITVDNN